jgi:hypothetical protein
MKRLIVAAIAVVAVGVGGGSARAQWSSPPSGWESSTKKEAPSENVFSVVYVPPKTERLKQWMDLSRLLAVEKTAAGLSKMFKMPRPLPIVFIECGTVNAFYTSDKHAILACYEILEYFYNLYKPTTKTDEQVGRKIAGAFYFTFFHELGHALAGELELPITGKEEDAADQLAAIILTKLPGVGRECALAAAEWFAIEGENKQKKGNIAWYDEHSFDLQRMYDILCILYGDDQKANAGLVKSVGMSEDRQARCVRETPKKVKAWEALLRPYARK